MVLIGSDWFEQWNIYLMYFCIREDNGDCVWVIYDFKQCKNKLCRRLYCVCIS